jgi:hypothetical protein
MIDDGLRFVPTRRLIGDPIEMLFPLAVGDRPLVAPAEAVVPGARIAERLRDARIVGLGGAIVPPDARPGDRWVTAGHAGIQLRRGPGAEAGELLVEQGGQWLLAAGEHAEPIETPLGGVVRDVRPGIGIRVRAEGRVIHGVEAHGDPTRGRLSLGTEGGQWTRPGAGLRSGGLDVGLAGTILVLGSRVDAEALTRARAMGVRGVVVSGLAGKERRDFLASERRQRAALHRLPPFAVLVLDGALRRPIAGPVAAVLDALAGKEVAIVVDPPALVFDDESIEIAPATPDHVRVRSGEHAGREGRWAGLAGLRRFAGGTFLEAGWVVSEAEAPTAVPLADLERYV